MEEKKANKSKKNRSSIIRVIISNYDMQGLKEIKILYQKQSEVDIFNLDTTIDSNFENIIVHRLIPILETNHKNKYYFDCIKNIDNNSFTVTKYSLPESNILRKYTLSFAVKESKIVTVKIKDELPHVSKNSGERQNIREVCSQTERKLLSEKLCKNYSQITKLPVEQIDSVKIYKVKRFLNYRSNLLTYFALINDFICTPLKDEDIKEIWHIKKDINVKIDKITDFVFNKISDEIEKKNRQFENNITKNNNKIEEIKNNKELKGQVHNLINDINTKNINLKSKIAELNIPNLKENLKEDLKKIISIFSKLRHSLMHYDYLYFENIFENKENKELEELLNLNIFKYLKLIDDFKVENKTNYLEDNDKIYILGKKKNIKDFYSYYNNLCDKKSGFNKFINSFFYTDGVENSDFKDLINSNFKKEIEELKVRIKDNKVKLKDPDIKKYQKKRIEDSLDEDIKILKNMEKQLKNMETVYFPDIHLSIKYKKLYCDRKELIEKYNAQLNGLKSKTAVTSINKQLLDLKNKMDEITKLNSLYRLKYKLQLAYGFLMEEFNGDLNDFKNRFNPTKLDETNNYLKKKKDYLDYKISSNPNFDSNKFKNKLKKLSSESKKGDIYLEKNSENNLFKFYMLTYIMLPIEFKGDFLGFVKNHYYNIKNVNISDNNVDLDSEVINDKDLIEKDNNGFFHKIRLFEKNIKKYEIIKYSISTHEDMKRYFELLNLKVPFIEYKATDEIGIFNKNMVLPIFKYYQNVFKLYNDIEIHALLKLDPNLEIALKILKSTDKNNNINFKHLIFIHQELKDGCDLEQIRDNLFRFEKELVNSKEKNYINKKFNKNNNAVLIRNYIAHLNYEFLFSNLFNNNLFLNKNVRKIIEFSQENHLDKIDLGMNFINDYYMKKQRFIFNQRRLVSINDQNPDNIIDGKRKKQNDKNNELLSKYKFNKNKNQLSSIHKMAMDLKELGENENNSEQIKEASDLMGIYKEYVIRKLKEEIIKRFTYEEEKIITISIYDNNIKETLSPIIRKVIKDSSGKYLYNNKPLGINENKLFDDNIYFEYEYDTREAKLLIKPKVQYEKSEDKKIYNTDIYLNSGYVFKKKITYEIKAID